MINITPLTKTQKFIEKAKSIHGDRYDYSLVEYIKANEKVIIICSKHGLFNQTPSHHHSMKQGCPKCAGVGKTTDDYIEKAKLTHGDKYDYSDTRYLDSQNKVEILCKEHGYFKQKPNDHLKGIGCLKCAGYNKTTQDFILEANNIHGNKYNYLKVNYINNKIKIKIICPKHGIFIQTPNSHLNGSGCYKCNLSKGEKQVENYLKSNRIKYINQYKFKNCKDIRVLPFDFYLPELNICIEYHGIQHYEPVGIFGGENEFKGIIKRDKIKKEFCIQNEILYIELNKNNIDEIQTIIGFYTRK